MADVLGDLRRFSSLPKRSGRSMETLTRRTFSTEAESGPEGPSYHGRPASNAGSTSKPQNHLSAVFRECLLSFCFDFIGLLAGLVLALQLDLFQFSPWIITVYPAILSAKGIIAGMLAGRLGTALHLGTVYPRFTRNTNAFYRLFNVVVVMTLITSLLMGIVAVFFGVLFWGVDAGGALDIILNIVATMALGLTISILTIYISFLSFKRGLDPDVIVYPVMSSTADVIITVYYIAVVSAFFLLSNLGRIIIVSINIFYFAFTILIVLHNVHSKEFARDIKETMLTLIIVAFIVNVTGTFLGRISAIVEERREVYTVYPAIIDMVGDVGSVVGSVSTTRLALGLINPSIKAIRKLREHIFGSWLASLMIFAFLSLISLMLTGTINPLFLAHFTSILVTANVIAVPIIIVISFLISILTFRAGLDPDNFVIPMESSLADSIATVALLLSLLLHRL